MFKKIKDKVNERTRDLKFANAYSIAALKYNHEAFSDIKGCNKGKVVALCATGPSIADYKPIPDVFHVAVNRAVLFDKVRFEWLIVADWRGIDFVQDKVAEYDCVKFFAHQIGQYESQIPESFRMRCNARRYYTDSFLTHSGFKSRFVCDIDAMPIGNMANIALQAMQILLFSYPKEILLVGVDASNKGHFAEPQKLQKNDIMHMRELQKACTDIEKTLTKWTELKEFAKVFYPDVTIKSVNPVGLKGVFEDIYQ